MTLALAAAAVVLTGCGGMERKLGRGINNSTEMFRLGEMRRSIEQASLWEGTDSAFTTGLVRGVGRTVARTAVGFSEVVTAPFPPYSPYSLPEKMFRDPTTRLKDEPFSVTSPYPDNYPSRPFSDALFHTDSRIGFGGGEVIPIVPGSRFRVFEY
ncbi:MAG: exosortase system-associated protein, TIGR04073 family [Limisphaerales bacterium]